MSISITRLHIRHWRFLPGFAFHALRSQLQAKSSSGFVEGSFATEPGLVFWTVTIWSDEAAMRSFRNSGNHLAAMRRLAHWCSEASYAHWEQPEAGIPTAAALFQRMAEIGQLSKVRHASATHAAGVKVGNAEPTPATTFRARP